MWKKWLIFVFTLCGFITTQLFVNNVSAVNNITRSFSSGDSVTSGSAVFPDCNSSCLGDYNYLIISNPSASYLNSNNLISFSWRPGSSSLRQFWVPSAFPLLVYELDFDSSGSPVFNFNENVTFSSDVTFTLTENYSQSCPDCPEPEPQEPCEDDTNFIVALFKDGFWGVATAMVYLIVPILALFLVFRLVHDLMWGRK